MACKADAQTRAFAVRNTDGRLIVETVRPSEDRAWYALSEWLGFPRFGQWVEIQRRHSVVPVRIIEDDGT